ncbi:pullulanase-type starch debranching enzyme1 [Zea mays]|uniref:Pullulanase-type starch debranching enzyme1 n=1 Tax=Zea mays TaxID=4577 RepID=A0A1D6EFE1_MAIZE|nr:pullulanase-type starch debranching enzyme1 [Zea mays]
MLLHAGPSFLLAPPPRFAAAPSSASPRRSRTPQSSPPTSHFARPADPVAQRVRPVAPRPPMATAEEGASSDVGVAVAESAQGFLLDARAYWVTKSLIAWNISDQKTSLFLYASRNATMCMSSQDMKGYDSKVELQPENDGLPSSVTQKFPFISSYRAFRIPSSVDVATLVKCQLAVASFDAHGNRQDVTGLQLPGVLDDMFAYTGPLGTIFSEEAVSMYLWAPTAQDVSVSFYDGPAGPLLETVQLNELNGVWSVTGPRNWENRYYLYEVTVYHQTTGNIEKCLAADPYARGLSANSTRTWLVDINNETLKPLAWDGLAAEKPRLDSFSDISIYELHIRDFSAHDSTVDCPFRGGFCAFTFQDSVGIEHLKKLSDAGLTHVHLLPSFQFGGVDDIKSNWKCVDEIELSKLPPGSDLQQAAIVAIQEEDPYNWGYNPVVWGVPKGSYASNPDGPSRIIEYRLMVQALNRLGLRVVMDVVYNHLYSSGPFAITSVLDKIVPGYYLRRDSNGQTENSAAVNNTASEHFMVDRLIVDDLLNWAVNYKVDGFRFDLMGHIMKKTMRNALKLHSTLLPGFSANSHCKASRTEILEQQKMVEEQQIRAKSALQSLTIDEHGVDGSKIYFFNDRIRDAINGGSPFGNPLQQGFSTGLFLEINYASAHDNETLFDIISLKTPMDLSIDERCRINHLSTSMIALSQGIPFFHAGDEILRSKSLDRDSYDSGDWFNKYYSILWILMQTPGKCSVLLFEGLILPMKQTIGVLGFHQEKRTKGAGLFILSHNMKIFRMKPRLENPSFKPAKHDIIAALDKFIDILKIRYSSPLFRLTTASDIVQRVHFHNTGPSLVPGVIVMSIEDARNDRHDMAQIDETFSCVVTVFNVCPYEVSIEIPDLASLRLQLHPVQVNSSDALARQSAYDTATGRFTVPKRTAAVFVEPRC